MNKFENPKITAKGETRAWVELGELKTLWFNTGTRCNLSCDNCYIESSPTNDRLVYLTLEDVKPFLAEIEETELIGFTGGEPFLNPQIMAILKASLASGRDVLVLTNAYRVLKRHQNELLSLLDEYGEKLHIRVSLDHYGKELHEKERGKDTFKPTLESAKWLFDQGFNLSVAGRSTAAEDREKAQQGYTKTLREVGIEIDVENKLVIFPEMIADENVPEITTACWDILGKKPEQQMCANERMIVKRKDTDTPVVLPCTLLAYDEQFELGHTLKSATKKVYLNHVFCSKFCVLGGSSCSATK